MFFLQAVVEKTLYETSGHLTLKSQMKKTYIPGTSCLLCISTRTGRGDGRMDGGDQEEVLVR